MNENVKPPATYSRFIENFPELAEAWETIGRASRKGPLDERTQRLIKLAVAMGALREGAVHASVRKARALGIGDEELRQVVTLAAGTMGLPSTVALFSWVEDRD
jgi:alkylhydroperoxidase/carboxymuconolactone decarboxylase family protein YurZ